MTFDFIVGEIKTFHLSKIPKKKNKKNMLNKRYIFFSLFEVKRESLTEIKTTFFFIYKRVSADYIC